MSRLHDALPPHPVAVPQEVASAWDWMEAQGYGGGDDERPFLTAYAGDRVLGPVFSTSHGDGWVEAWFGAGTPEGDEAGDRLRPIGEASGDGAVLALWQDDAGSVRAVVLGSEGDAYEVARTPLELLTLLAVGYVDLTDVELGLPPEEPEAVEAVAEFRAWLTSTHGVEVPEEWPAAEHDEFTTWVRRQRGEEVPDSPAGGSTTSGSWPPEVTGDLVVLLEALGTPDGSPEVQAVADLLDVPLADGGLRKAGRALRARGVEVTFEKGALAVVFVSQPPLGRLVDALPEDARLDDVLALLGEPESRSDEHGWVRYLVGGRFLHLTIEPGGSVGMVCLMAEWR